MTPHFSMIAHVGRLAVGVLLTPVVLMGCVLSAPSTDLLGTSSIDVDGEEARDALETLWGAPLPDTASDFHYYAYGWQDAIGYGRFVLPAEAWEATLASSTLCMKDALTTDQPIGFGNEQIDKAWWTPDNATQVLGGEQCQGKNGAFYHLVVDTSDENTYIVYVYAFTT